MIFRSSSEEQQAYRNSEAINQSLLKTLRYGPGAFTYGAPLIGGDLEEYKRDKRQFILGTGAEILTTYGEEALKSSYYVTSLPKVPSEAVTTVIRRAFDSLSHLNREDKEFVFSDEFKANVYDGMNMKEYYMNRKKETWQEDSRYIALLKDGLPYWEALLACGNKQEISNGEYELVKIISKNWVTCVPTAKVFECTKNQDIYYQLPIYFEYKGISCKALLDMVKVDKANKIIMPYDLKTIGASTLRFIRSVKEFRYDIQAAFYYEALLHWIEQMQYQGWTIEPFTFIVESTTQPGIPLLYPCTSGVIKLGKFGVPQKARHIYVDEWDHKYRQINIPIDATYGFDTLIEEYKWYQTNGWNVHRTVIEKGGIIPITFNELL